MAAEKSNDVREDLESLKADLQTLRDDLGKATGSLYSAGRESAHAAGQQAREGVAMAGKYVRDSVSERPVTSLLVAAGVGVLIGVLFQRRYLADAINTNATPLEGSIGFRTSPCSLTVYRRHADLANIWRPDGSTVSRTRDELFRLGQYSFPD